MSSKTGARKTIHVLPFAFVRKERLPRRAMQPQWLMQLNAPIVVNVLIIVRWERLSCHENFKERESSMLRITIGILIGAALGFIYYKLVGCPTGTCPITRSPINSMIYGALMGGIASYRHA
jgi:hypothetical protein